MKSNVFLFAVLTLLILTFFGGGYLFLRKQQNFTQEDIAGIVYQEKDEDIKVIRDPKSEPDAIYKALNRLAHHQIGEALEFALKNRKDTRAFIREASANALGHFDDPDAVVALEDCLQDIYPQVRLRALQSIAFHKSKDRENLVSNFLTRKDLTPQEQVVGLSVLAKVADTYDRKKQTIADLIAFAEQGDDEPHILAAMLAIPLAGDSQAILSLIRKKISEGKNEVVIGYGIGILAAKKDPYLAQNISKLAQFKSPQVRIGVLQSLKVLCPPDRWTYVKQIADSANKENDITLAAIHEAVALGGQEAKIFLESLKKGPPLPRETFELLDAKLQELGSSKQSEACLEKPQYTKTAPPTIHVKPNIKMTVKPSQPLKQKGAVKTAPKKSDSKNKKN